MKQVLLLILLVGLTISKSFSQESYQLEEMFLDADSWFFYEDYEEALPLYLRVLEADSLNYNVMYKIGFCYLHTPGQKAKSIPYLEEAINKTTLNYRDNIYAEKSAPVDAIFYLGNAYLVNNKINEAIDAYSGFQNKITKTKKIANKDIYDTEYLSRQFDACKNALQMQYEPVNFIARNLGSPINTRFNEFNAIVSGDGLTLVFTASLKFYDAIFYSKKENDQWSYPINIMGQLGVDDKSASTGLSFDGTELFIYRDDDFDGNIYVSNLNNGIWSKIKKLGENINTKYWESHASLSPDNKKLYFTSNREGGYGDLDIYESERVNDSTWGKAKNLGKIINSRWNENTPFLTPDGKRLFFSSEGHKGMGGYDIYYSTLDNEEWSEPVNIGYPINTTDDDIFFAPNENGNFAYCSQFSRKGYGGQDIYKFQLLDLPKYNLLVEGVKTMDNENDRNKKDFIINIIDTINHDTIAILQPDSGNLNYQFLTPLGKNHLVYESLVNEKTGNQYYISKAYEIKEIFLSPTKDEEIVEIATDTLPEIILDKDKYLTETDQNNVKIKLSLQKGNKLFVNTFYKDNLINTEEFDINKVDFIYEYKPLVGESKIQFKLVDKNNNVKYEEVSISYLPKDLVAELNIEDKIVTLTKTGEKNVKIILSVERGSKLIVETFVDNQLINTETFDVKKKSFTYEFEPKSDKSELNFKLVDKHNNVKNEQITISHTPISKDFAKILTEINSFDNKEFQDIIKSSEIKSASSTSNLLSIIYSKAATAGLSSQQAQALIIALAINSTKNTPEFISNLLKISKGDLHLVLDSINRNQKDFENNLAIVQYLELKAASNNYTNKDIIKLLEQYLQSSDISVNELLIVLDNILVSDISNILANLDASAIDIVTLEDFKKYLDNKHIYSPEELNQLYSLMQGMLIASKAAEEIETSIEESPILAEESEKDKNIWMIFYIGISGILLGLIIIFFNRRNNKASKKKDL